MRSPTLPCCLGLALLHGLAGCGGDAKQAPKQQPVPETKQADMHHCTISLARKAVETVTGEGKDADPGKAKEAAWVDACNKLSEATRAGCRDPQKFTPAETTSAAAGKTTHSVSLTAVAPHIEGKAEWKDSKAEACKEAVQKACAAAGEQGDCLASGAYIAVGKAAGVTQVTVQEPQ